MPIPKEKWDDIKAIATLMKKVLKISDLKTCSEEDKIIYQAVLTYEVQFMLKEYDKKGHRVEYYNK